MMPTHSRRNLLFGLLKPPQQPKAAGALRPQPPAAEAGPRLVAQIQPFDCLAQRGQVCSVCAERCPTPGVISIDGRRVQIRESLCTGCGICQQVCPAPQNAIILWPAAPVRRP